MYLFKVVGQPSWLRKKEIFFFFFPWIFLGLASQTWLLSVNLGIVSVGPHDEHCRFLNEARDDFFGLPHLPHLSEQKKAHKEIHWKQVVQKTRGCDGAMGRKVIKNTSIKLTWTPRKIT